MKRKHEHNENCRWVAYAHFSDKTYWDEFLNIQDAINETMWWRKFLSCLAVSIKHKAGK